MHQILKERALSGVLGLLILSALSLGCKDKGASSTVGNATIKQTAKSAPVLGSSAVEAVTNPEGKEKYTGALGGVRGVVRVTGDKPPVLEGVVKKLPVGKCYGAHERYKFAFREGPGRTLGDALVAVTEYKGNVAVPPLAKPVEAKGCAFDRRTYALGYGQSLEVFNRGEEAYMPDLRGARNQAILVAVPGGAPVTLTPPNPGLYQLVDRSHPFIFANVYVVAYPTTTSTDLDGKFEITGIPVGSAKVSAMLPITGETTTTSVTIEANKLTELVLEVPFSAEAFKKQLDTSESSGAAGSAAPSSAGPDDEKAGSASSSSSGTP